VHGLATELGWVNEGMNVFVFDIETVPDVEGGRHLYHLDGLSDEDVAKAMVHIRREESGLDFLRLHLHRIVAISVALRESNRFKLWSLGCPGSPEEELIRRFLDGIEKFTPNLVSWNGSGFDLPVVHYRSLVHGISAPRYWESGASDQCFRWNNYLNRYHERHTDLLEVLAAYQPRAYAPLDEVATLCGLPGKMGMSGEKVWECYVRGDIAQIRDYCETDVLNTYLLYLRYELMRGHLTPERYAEECRLVRDTLETKDRPHLNAFLEVWK
jgi:Predicted 3''-5'' exonuclease related to the exonuclease domain of PolB